MLLRENVTMDYALGRLWGLLSLLSDQVQQLVGSKPRTVFLLRVASSVFLHTYLLHEILL